MKLKLENYRHNSKLSVPQFLYLFLNNLNFTCNTTNEDGTQVTCPTSKFRTLSDIQKITQFYFPNEDLPKEKVKDILLDFGTKLVGWYCDDIGKRIYEHWDRDRICAQHLDDATDEENVFNDEFGDPLSYRSVNKYPRMREEIIKIIPSTVFNSLPSQIECCSNCITNMENDLNLK